jgi:Sulfate permease family
VSSSGKRARAVARLPVFTSLQGYRPAWLRGDAVAGLTVWAVLVPEALAYASIAGVSPVVGLYAAPGALIFYAACCCLVCAARLRLGRGLLRGVWGGCYGDGGSGLARRLTARIRRS